MWLARFYPHCTILWCGILIATLYLILYINNYGNVDHGSVSLAVEREIADLKVNRSNRLQSSLFLFLYGDGFTTYNCLVRARNQFSLIMLGRTDHKYC